MGQPFAFYLDWLPNVQFAGICWALDRRLYSDAGLDVTLIPWVEDGRSIVQKVLAGGLCAGSAEDNLVLAQSARGAGQVSALAAMFQTTPLIVMSRPESSIRRIGDLRARRVAMHSDGIRILEAMLDLHGISRSDLDLFEVTHDLDNLLERRFDAVQGYAVSEPLELAARGLNVSTFTLRHPDLHPYAQVDLRTGCAACRPAPAFRAIPGGFVRGLAGLSGEPGRGRRFDPPRRRPDAGSGTGDCSPAPGQPARDRGGGDGRARSDRSATVGSEPASLSSARNRPVRHTTVVRARHLAVAADVSGAPAFSTRRNRDDG